MTAPPDDRFDDDRPSRRGGCRSPRRRAARVVTAVRSHAGGGRRARVRRARRSVRRLRCR